MASLGVSYKNALRLAGELSIVRVLNDFQPLSILRVN
ncbi:capsid protein [Escherichia sp. E2661]|nr:capsid protein [Escherichia sp. E2661]TGC04940.1 capsid protein [Escherichia sp. E2661]